MDDRKLIRTLTRERDQALEEVLQLRKALGLQVPSGQWEPPAALRLSWQEIKVLKRLYHNETSTVEELYLALYGAWGDRTEHIVYVYICKLRGKLRPYGIGVELQGWRSATYALTPGAKERLAMIQDPKCSRRPKRDIIDLSMWTPRGRGPRARRKASRADPSTTSE